MGTKSIRSAVLILSVLLATNSFSRQLEELHPTSPLAIAALQNLTQWLVQSEQHEAVSKLSTSLGFFFYKDRDKIRIHTTGIEAVIAGGGLVVEYSFRGGRRDRNEGPFLDSEDAREIVDKALANYQNESWRPAVNEKILPSERRLEFRGRFELKEIAGAFHTGAFSISITFDVERRRISDFRAYAPPPILTERIGPLLKEDALWETALTTYFRNEPLPAASTVSRGLVYCVIPISEHTVWFSSLYEQKSKVKQPIALYEAFFGQPSTSLIIQKTVWIDASTGQPVAIHSRSLDAAVMTPFNVVLPTKASAASGKAIRGWINPQGDTRVLLQTENKRVFPATYSAATGKLTSDWGPNHEWQATDSQIWEILKLLRAK